jgi:hypothetical protein
MGGDFNMIYLIYNKYQTGDMNNPNRLRSLLLIVIALLLAGLSVAHTPRNLDSVNPALVATPTVTPLPITEWRSGSTDGIFLWATLMLIVVVVALVWHRADWTVNKV